jgi:transcriptional regulator with XRE-family HTH domain
MSELFGIKPDVSGVCDSTFGVGEVASYKPGEFRRGEIRGVRNMLYSEILEIVRKAEEAKAMNQNHRSAFIGWMKHFKKVPDDKCGEEITDEEGFEKALFVFSKATSKSPAVAQNKRSLIRKVRSAAVDKGLLITDAELAKDATFDQKLTSAIKLSGRKVTDIAREVLGDGTGDAVSGLSKAISYWMRGGRRPSQSSLEHLRRLEKVLNVPEGFFTGHAIKSYITHADNIRKTRRGEISTALMSSPNYKYGLKSFPEAFNEKWRGFVKFKTKPSSDLRQGKMWGKGGATQKHVEQVARCFLGFLKNIRAMDEENFHPILFCDKELIELYLDFLVQRNKSSGDDSVDVMTPGGQKLIAIVSTLVNERTGYVTQLVANKNHGPQPFIDALKKAGRQVLDFDDWLRRTRLYLSNIKKYNQNMAAEENSSQAEIRDFLMMEDPGQILRDFRKKVAESVKTARNRAHAEADVMLIAAFEVAPFRVNTWVQVTLDMLKIVLVNGPDGSTQEERVEISVPRRCFKNQNTKTVWNGHTHYRMLAPRWFTELYKQYVKEGGVRSQLGGAKNSNRFFVPYHDTVKLLTEQGIRSRMNRLTATFLPGHRQLSCHWIRHVVATAFNKKYPTNLVTLADILNDDIATVKATYARSVPGQNMNDYAKYSDDMYS